jgi:hypothetical protein
MYVISMDMAYMLPKEKPKTGNGDFADSSLMDKRGLLYDICDTINSFKSPQMEGTVNFVIGTVSDYFGHVNHRRSPANNPGAL